MASRSNAWKNLERDTATWMNDLLVNIAYEKCRQGYGQFGIPDDLLSKDKKLIERNKRGDDFGRTDSDVDVVTPWLIDQPNYKRNRLHDYIGGPIIIEAKYRKGSVIPRLLNDFSKTRPASRLIPMMILSCRGKHYLARWLQDFKHIDWMRDLSWNDIWITSKKLNKSNTYIEDWLKQSEDYFPMKAKQFDVPEEDFHPMIATRGNRTKVLIIQRLP